jgi:hypothetical protein
MRRHIMWNKSVFFTLLGVGATDLVVIWLIGRSLITSIYQVIIPIIMGLVLGGIVTMIETDIHQQKRGINYHPTQSPYIILGGILLLNILFDSLRLWIGEVFGSYLLVLAFVFRTYEKNIGRRGITWNELLSE